MGKENDGKIVLTFSNDKLEVRGDFFPPQEDGNPITPDYITDLLGKYNIVHGVQLDEMNEAFRKCTEENTEVKSVLIARGDIPVNEELEYMKLNPFLGRKKEFDKNAAVDHRQRSPFIIVKKDQVLGKHIPRRQGKEGINVHGDRVDFKTVQPEGVSPGENTRVEEGRLLSNIHGQLAVSKKVVNVRESLLVKGSVGYGTGNIVFPGDVDIHGTVSDGFKIYSGGSVTIRQTFDVTDSIIRKDLNVAGGIIGRGQALVKVGGSLKTKFIENCKLACRKDIFVELEIINSNVFTLETLQMTEKGKIVGGEIYAFKGLRTGSIGKKSGKTTRIHCGIDFTLEQERERNNNILKVVAAKMRKLKEILQDPQTTEEKKKKIDALILKLEADQKKASAKISELLAKQKTFEDAAVEVSGEIVPGTLIEICQTALFVTAPLKKVRIRFNKLLNKLITENL